MKPGTFVSSEIQNAMTHFNNESYPQQNQGHTQIGRWVKTRLEGTEKYSLSVMGKADMPQKSESNQTKGCAYAKLSLMESGAVMASFPVMGMVSGTIRSLLGATWFELASPLKLPEFVFGHEIEIAAGRHPIVFVLESWVVMFRPSSN